jgi:hypothetical protein
MGSRDSRPTSFSLPSDLPCASNLPASPMHFRIDSFNTEDTENSENHRVERVFLCGSPSLCELCVKNETFKCDAPSTGPRLSCVSGGPTPDLPELPARHDLLHGHAELEIVLRQLGLDLLQQRLV